MSLPKRIKSLEDVRAFALHLRRVEHVSLCTDTDFNEYVELRDGHKAYKKREADARNRLMERCRTLCRDFGADINQVMDLKNQMPCKN